MKKLLLLVLVLDLLCIVEAQGQSQISLQTVSCDIKEIWVTRHDEPGKTNDYAQAMVVDKAGNVYITGYSGGIGYVTVKYDAVGMQKWVAHHEVKLGIATALAVDSEGNVYITGYSRGSSALDNYITIKYNAAGQEQWVVRYSESKYDNAKATAITVDGEGNVYVTGQSWRTGTKFDYATIKSNAAGQVQWVVRYNGPGNGRDEANAIAVDGEGNLYVTGQSERSRPNYDYATIKYNSAGQEQWVARYNGGRHDEAKVLALDDEGNVYVTGRSEGVRTNFDYATIKYNSAGQEQWVARYNGPGNSFEEASDLAIDNDGNIYVTGQRWDPSTAHDYTTVKYNSAGQEQWIARYNGPGNGRDEANAIAVDVNGNVYVTGQSERSNANYDYATIKYNSAGQEQWVIRYNGSGQNSDYAVALGLDSDNNVYVSGSSYGSKTDVDYATIKYDPDGTELWLARHDERGYGTDYAQRMIVDEAGNVYVTGYTAGIGYVTVKYDAVGMQKWVADYKRGVATAMTVDREGNVYVTGYSNALRSLNDYVTIKYNAAGQEQWVVRYYESKNDHAQATAVAVDGDGNVYVTGQHRGSGTESDYATIKYNSAGQKQWVARYNGPRNGRDEVSALALDGEGNVYVTGRSENLNRKYDYATIKYNSAGQEQWVARYNGPGNGHDEASALVVDGNVYVTGQSLGSITKKDYATIKYNSAGQEQWVARYNGPGNGVEEASALALDSEGNVYVAGQSRDPSTASDYATVKYNSAGQEQWVARYNGPGYGADEASALALDGEGNVYVTGQSERSNANHDYATIKYNATGTQEWMATYNGPGNGNDNPVAIAVDGAGNVYVAGSSVGLGTGYDFAAIKYAQNPIAGWNTQHIVDVDDVIFGVNQSAAVDSAPRNIHGLALSPDEQYLYLSYTQPTTRRLVRKIKLNETSTGSVDPANNHAAVVAQLDLGTGAPAKALATDDKGRVYLARPHKIWIYKSDLSAALYIIDGFTNCAGVAVTRESGKLVVYATEVTPQLLKRFELTEGPGEKIIASTKAGLDGNGEILIKDAINNLNAISPRGLDVQINGTIWVADFGAHRVFRFNPDGSAIVSLGANRAMDIAIDEARGEVYVSQSTLRRIKVFDLNGTHLGFMAPAVADVDLDGETGFGELSGLDVASCQRLFVSNEKGRSILTGDPLDSPFSDSGDNNDVKAADTDPVLVATGNVMIASLSKDEEPEAPDLLASDADKRNVVEVVTQYELAQSYPNPFNPSTLINFSLPVPGDVKLRVYDINGQLVRTLVAGEMSAGRHSVSWNGRHELNRIVAAGMYIYKITVEDANGRHLFTQTRRMLFLK